MRRGIRNLARFSASRCGGGARPVAPLVPHNRVCQHLDCQTANDGTRLKADYLASGVLNQSVSGTRAAWR